MVEAHMGMISQISSTPKQIHEIIQSHADSHFKKNLKLEPH